MSILFKELNLLPQTQKALTELELNSPTPIQSLVIPEMIKGNDIIAQSQTGTGKTFSFGIPIIEKIDPKISYIQSLVLCPTRELALQVFLEIKKLLKFYPEIRIAVIYGGESYIKQFQALEKKPHIIIATPGRIIDLLERKKIDLTKIYNLTLDEADEMLKMGFQESLETILQNIPEKRQTVLFSATLPLSIKQIATKYQKNPEIIRVKSKNLAVKLIDQFYFMVKEFDKNKLLVRLLDYKNPDSVIIFANTKKDVDAICSYLLERGFSADAIHGDLKQNQRQCVMNSFRTKNTKILIATDVAARGIDISDITMIINYDLPHETEVYVHRIGRTGRAGKTGIAFSFVSVKQIIQLKRLEQYLKDKINLISIPSVEEVQKEQNNFFKNKIISLIEKDQNSSQDKNINDIIIILLDKFDSKQIIKSLLSYLIPNKKNYEYISEVKTFNSRFSNKSNYYKDNYNSYSKVRNTSNSYNSYNSRSRYNNNSNDRKPMVQLSINLGKDDGINPSLFLKLLNEKYNIYSKNIGNIKHFYKKTVFEISTNLVKLIKSKNNIYYENKMLNIEEIR
ncbi:DEAD/DEAH box helicase [Texas Phoenix palm phytoplasma]|uniref:DEAD/DEAH box helicase n=1 Tax=Texas Phoenix palm phytoplasma TaxID=176709 RepID=A0ABS5BID6_9MOLU|nr:DEAD/DEAH box helicase [Texas Phoenix palm phytoplasma]MBP3059350.1 DEAD/DEAH box helicase [Texas Phoenix palm phytoplasma]